MSTHLSLARTFAAPGAFVGAAIFLYAALPFGAAKTESETTAPGGAETVPAVSQGEIMGETLTPEQLSYLDEHKWESWVGQSLAVWVSVDEQYFRVVRDGKILWQGPCATAAQGTGSQMNSFKTPLGWHSIKRKVGDGAPLGQVFRGAKATKEIWKPGQATKEDLVLTRLLWLTGEEPGKNMGGNVDSYSRYIYIHGTNEEEKIGTPSSHGCVRMKNADVVTVFDMLPEGTHVLITEKKPAQ
ncbi:MAG TPA: L,D-transpeptidase [Candidatus Hydrogenedentes bacterium]|nr:L,D-transpeptidase [Candidatus Hydrogenedentota bacterium]